MPTVPDAPLGRQPGQPATSINLCDHTQAASWLIALRDKLLDCTAAGEDATRRPKKRMFSRFEARRRIREAEGDVLHMIEAAQRGLPQPIEG
ncbi:Hypothetical protein A7982_10576 [Minicystis rosea]|nr:Hypothetical protein A7982_10576 [Minicystis rosea]